MKIVIVVAMTFIMSDGQETTHVVNRPVPFQTVEACDSAMKESRSVNVASAHKIAKKNGFVLKAFTTECEEEGLKFGPRVR